MLTNSIPHPLEIGETEKVYCETKIDRYVGGSVLAAGAAGSQPR